MRTLLSVSALVAALSVPGTLSAQQQVHCLEREAMLRELAQEYGQSRFGRGPVHATSLYELFYSQEHGTWTLVYSTPQKRACVLARGEGWEFDSFMILPDAGDPA